jgi:hypothetical protein
MHIIGEKAGVYHWGKTHYGKIKNIPIVMGQRGK